MERDAADEVARPRQPHLVRHRPRALLPCARPCSCRAASSKPGFPLETSSTRVTVLPSITSASWRSSSTSTRRPAPDLIGVGRDACASAAFVAGPATPSRPSRCHFWNATIANVVCRPHLAVDGLRRQVAEVGEALLERTHVRHRSPPEGGGIAVDGGGADGACTEAGVSAYRVTIPGKSPSGTPPLHEQLHRADSRHLRQCQHDLRDARAEALGARPGCELLAQVDRGDAVRRPTRAQRRPGRHLRRHLAAPRPSSALRAARASRSSADDPAGRRRPPARPAGTRPSPSQRQPRPVRSSPGRARARQAPQPLRRAPCLFAWSAVCGSPRDHGGASRACPAEASTTLESSDGLRRFRYVVCDVFTDTPLDRNQLAVFTDARDLTPRTMQALAKEMNFSETVFVLPPRATDADVRIRIFTPASELPFAGPPDARHGVRARRAAAEDRDPARDRRRRRAGRARARGAARSSSAGWSSRSRPGSRSSTARRAPRRARRRRGSGLPVERYDLGPGHVYVELDSAEAVAALRPDLARARARHGATASTASRATAPRWKTRMFAPAHGVAGGSRDRLGRRAARGPSRPARPHRLRRGDRDLARGPRSTGRRCSTRRSTATRDAIERVARRRLGRHRRARRVQSSLSATAVDLRQLAGERASRRRPPSRDT